MLDEVTEHPVQDLLAITKALSDETRVRALLTVRDGELCLCQIIDVLGLSPSTVSKHMSVLQQAGLVHRRKEGKWHFYRLADDGDGAATAALRWVLEALKRDPTIREDARNTRAVRRRDLEELSACYR
jgi:DNA-binding transcriptional ArsR family regulator